MAGDWMKIELDLADKPEIHYISSILKIEPDAVIGKLIRVWAWFDKHTTDGNAHGVTFAVVDRMAGLVGFGEAMQFAGWLSQKGTVLSMPKFNRHNGESAKKRALTSERVAKHRNARSVTETLPEKRRKENKGLAVGVAEAATRINEVKSVLLRNRDDKTPEEIEQEKQRVRTALKAKGIDI